MRPISALILGMHMIACSFIIKAGLEKVGCKTLDKLGWKKHVNGHDWFHHDYHHSPARAEKWGSRAAPQAPMLTGVPKARLSAILSERSDQSHIAHENKKLIS